MLPAAPVIDGHTLIGAVVVRLSPSLIPDGPPLWVSCAGCQRHGRAATVSDDTGRAVRRVVAEILLDWATRLDRHEMRTAHQQWRAQFDLAESARRVALTHEAVLVAADAYQDARAEEQRLLRLVDAFDRRTGLV